MDKKNWILKNFGKLVKKYGGKYIAVVKNKVVAVGKSLKEVDTKARKKFPKFTPSILHVPKEEEMSCVLKSSITPSIKARRYQ